MSEGRFLGMKLAGAARPFNMVTFYWAALDGILLQTFIPQMQPYLLTEFLHIPEGQQGVVSGDLSFWGEVVIIVMVGVWGTLSDRIGRRPVMALGLPDHVGGGVPLSPGGHLQRTVAGAPRLCRWSGGLQRHACDPHRRLCER